MRAMSGRIGQTSCRNMLRSPRRDRMPVKVDVPTRSRASRVAEDNSVMPTSDVPVSLLAASAPAGKEGSARRFERCGDCAEHMVGGGKINRRGAESVPAPTCVGELDDVLVAMRDGAIGKLAPILLAPVDAVNRSSLPACVKSASRLPGITERAARGALAGHSSDVAKCGGAGDAVDEGDRRPDVVGVGAVAPVGRPEGLGPETMNTCFTNCSQACVLGFRARGQSPRPRMTTFQRFSAPS
jgi:hypothetical protein